MPILVRTRNEGKTFELRVTHKLLEKPFFRTFTTQHEAERGGVLALAELDKGAVPAWMLKSQEIRTIAAAIGQYRMNTAVPYSQAALLDTLVEEIGSTKLLDVGRKPGAGRAQCWPSRGKGRRRRVWYPFTV